VIDPATWLSALPDLRVLFITVESDAGPLVLVETIATDGDCPSRG
jgi:hypothetical protein